MSENGDGLHGDESAGTPLMAFNCPGCGRMVEVGLGAAAQVVACPECRTPFVVPGANGSTEVADDDAAREEAVARRESELDGLRMRHVIVQRRAAARSRTYAILGAGVCAMGAAKLLQMTYREVAAIGWGARPVAYVMVIVVTAWGLWYFAGRAAYWGRESRAGKMPEPEVAPDFSTLGDGSQRARDLEDVR